MSFTAEQSCVLSYFFTTTEGRVACATDNMPSSLWAYLIGSYSRSHEPIRDRLLTTLFKDTSLDIAAFAEAITGNQHEYLASALGAAEKFLRKWAVDYGHNSLKDSSIDRFAIEGCSILAAKAFEDSELGAYQEKSTRYLAFGVKSLSELALPARYLAEDGSLLPVVYNAFHRTFSVYESLLSYWEDRHFTELADQPFVNDAARRRTARASAFDKARYYLPTSVKTSFGATIQTRETVALLCRMLAHTSEEVRTLAAEVLTEVRKVNPGLFTRMEPDYTTDHLDLASLDLSWPEPLPSLDYVEHTPDSVVTTHKCDTVGSTVQLVASRDLRSRVAASFLSFASRRSGVPSSFRPIAGIADGVGNNLLALSKNSGRVGTVLNRAKSHYLQMRTTRHSGVPRYLDHVHVTFDIVMDYGAYRDMQRHRAGKQDAVAFLASVGVIEFPGFDTMPIELQAECRSAVAALKEARDSLDDRTYESGADATYLHLLGHPVMWTYTCSLKQLVYLAELRTQPSGHISYRAIAQTMANLVEQQISWLFPFLDRGSVASRADAENRIQEKLAALTA